MKIFDKLLRNHDFISSEWLTKSFLKASNMLGIKRVSDVEAALRISTCRACEHIGQVKKEVDFSDVGLPLLGKREIEYEGCKKCKCPIAVKPFYDTHLLQIVGDNSNNSNIVTHKVTCPHQDGDKWAKIKEQLNSQKQDE